LKPASILVIDDDAVFQSELKEALSSKGYEVTTVTDPKFALSAAKKVKPDVIILDIKLKGASGLDVFESLKESEAAANIPVIAVTGVYGKTQDLIKICGIKECLIKPFDPESLIDKIEFMLESKVVEREYRRIEEIEKTLDFEE